MKKKLLVLSLLGCVFTTTLLNGCGLDPKQKTEEEIIENTETEQSELVIEQPVINEEEDMEARMGYVWQEMTVVLPVEWEEHYVAEVSDDGFYLYQKSSYDENKDMGYLCGFTRSEDFSNAGAGETLLAYTDEGTCYYLMQPTDVTFDLENKEIADEYMKMQAQIPEIVSTLKIDKSDVHMDADEYILPLSSTEPVEDFVLSNLNDNDLMTARNEIYARHGRIFQNEYLQSYFNSCSWYQGTVMPEDFDEESLSQLEKDNLEQIKAAEVSYEEQHPYPVKYTYGTLMEEDLNQDGTNEQIFCSLMEQEDECFVPIVTINGRAFDISKDCKLITPVTDAFYVTDIKSADGELELAFLDYGPSNDPVTYFFRYDGDLEFVGTVDGFPFKDLNDGINGFVTDGGVYGRVRSDLIETAYLRGYWWLNGDTNMLEYQEGGLYDYIPSNSHGLYVDLTVHVSMDENSKEVVIPKQEEAYFMKSDLKEWILVKGKDGKKGYVHIKNGKVTDVGKAAGDVFTELHYFD